MADFGSVCSSFLVCCLISDEEISGRDGMRLYVKTDHFRSLNVGFALDEGLFITLLVHRYFFCLSIIECVTNTSGDNCHLGLETT